MATAREIKAKVRKDLEAQVTARTDAAVDVAKAHEKVTDLEAQLEAARGDYGEKITTALALMSAGELSALVGVSANGLRSAAKRRATTSDTTSDTVEDSGSGEPDVA